MAWIKFISELQMKNLLNNFNFEYDELKKLLYSTQSFIAGGAALKVFLNENYDENQDLDIFLPIPYSRNDFIQGPNVIYKKYKFGYLPFEELAKEKIKAILHNKGYYLTSSGVSNHHNCGNNPTKDIEYMKCALTHFIKNIINYENIITKKKIQIITVFEHSIQDILDTFDLNICQIAINCNDNSFYFNLENAGIQDLISKKLMYITNPLYPSNLEKRINKYLSRGFTWIKPNGEEVYFNKKPTPMDVNCYITTQLSNKIITYEEYLEIKANKKKEVIQTSCNMKDNDWEDEIPEISPPGSKIKNGLICCDFCEKKIINFEEKEDHFCQSCKELLCDDCIYGDEVTPQGHQCCDNPIFNITNSLYNDSDIQKGVKYMEDNNYLSQCMQYQFKDIDNENKQIMCLDEFYLLDDTYDINIKIKFDLENLIKSGSCYGLAKYIYQLIKYIKSKFKSKFDNTKDEKPNTKEYVEIEKKDLEELLSFIQKFQNKYSKYVK